MHKDKDTAKEVANLKMEACMTANGRETSDMVREDTATRLTALCTSDLGVMT